MCRQISVEEVKKHADKRSSWIIIHNDVYDVTKFLNEHPGGPDVLLEYAGKDGTKAFDSVSHSVNAKQLMVKYKIGSVSSHGSHCCCGPHHIATCLHSGFVPCPKNVIVLPVTSNECCTPNPTRVPKKTWRTFDGGRARVEGTASLDGSRSVDGSRSLGSSRSVGVGSQSAFSGSRSVHGGFGSGSTADGPRSFGGGGARGTKSKDGLAPSGGQGGKSRHSHGPLGFMKGPCQHCTNDPKTLRGPRPEDHVKSIIVPKESGKLKWALILLASALVVAIAVKKMKG